MSIPSLKRLGFSNFIKDNHGSDSLHRIPPPAPEGRAAPPTGPPGPGPRQRPGSRAAAGVAVAMLFLVGLFVMPPTVQAVNSDWTVSYANSLTDTVTEIVLAHDGERLGMAYKYSTGGAVGFSVRSTGGVWTQQNGAVMAGASGYTDLHLLNTGAGKWVLFGLIGATFFPHAFRSIDDGVTWADTAIQSTAAEANFDAAVISSTKIGVAACNVGGLTTYYDSTDNGATWSTGFRVDDNIGNPSSPPSGTSVGCSDGAGGATPGQLALTGGNDGQAYLAWTGLNSKAYYAHSTLGSDQFWTVPWYGGGACPSGCNPVDGGTTDLPWIPTVRNYDIAFPKNGDLMPVVQDDSCASTFPPNTARSIVLGRLDSPSNGGTCNSYSPASGVWDVMASSGCAAYGKTKYHRIAGNSAHVFIAGLGHTTLCSGVGFEIGLKSSISSPWAQTFTDPSQTNIFDVDMTDSLAYAAFVDTVSGGGVKIVSASSPTSSAVESTSVGVTNLVGYSMDPTGRTIIVRVNGGTDIQTYTDDVSLGTVGAASTPTCNRFDGVLAENFRQTIYTVYADCDGGGDTDTLSVRDAALAVILQDTDECPNRATGSDTVNDGDTDVPNQIQQVGLILGLPYDFSTCGGAGQTADFAMAGWSFSEIGTGNLGVFSVLYETGQDDQDTDTVQLDTSGTPLINDMCAWHNFNNDTSAGNQQSHHDYIGGIADQGPIGIWEITSEYHFTGSPLQPYQVNTALTQKFLNNGQFGNAVGIACNGDTIIVLKSNVLYVLNGVLDGSPSVGLTKTIISGVKRGLAVTGSGKFMAYTTGGNIEVAWIGNGTVTATFPIPSGLLRGMEFDSGGEKLAVFTSTLITVYDTGPVTCELSDSCASDSGVGSDEPPGTGGGGGPSPTPGPGSGGNLEDNVYFWIALWIFVVVVAIALVSWGTRAGFGGLVYITGIAIVYIIAMLLNNTDGGTTNVSPWPIVAVVCISIGFGITRWVRS